MRASAAIIVLVLGHALAGCGGSDSSSMPTTPSSVRQPPPPLPTPPRPGEPVTFIDSATGFSTSDVHDVQEQIVRFTTADELIWVADDRRFAEFIADGNFIAYHHQHEKFMQIRFGSKDGQRRAYLTWPDERLNGAVPTILDLWVDEHGALKIVETNVLVPGA